MRNSQPVSKAVFFILLVALSLEPGCSAATDLFPNGAEAWTKIPTVVVSGKDGDPRTQLVIDAVDFWNQQLSEIGSAFRLGPVTFTNEIIPDRELERRSDAVFNGGKGAVEPPSLIKIRGDIIVALSDSDLVICTSFLARRKAPCCYSGVSAFSSDRTECGPKCDSARAGPCNRAWPQQRPCVSHVWQTRLMPADCLSVWSSKVLPAFGGRKTNPVKTVSSYLEGR